MLHVLVAQACGNLGVTTRLTYDSLPDFWGADGIGWGTTFFNERTPQSLYLVGDTVHILWIRQSAGNRYNRSRNRGASWDFCIGSDCGGITILNYGWESSIVARGSKVHATVYCYSCSTSKVLYNRSLNNGTTWDYPVSGQIIFDASEYSGGTRSLDSPSMDASLSGDTILLVVDAFSHGLRVKRTFDGGNTWGPSGGIVIDPSPFVEKHPQIAYNEAGKWFVCYTAFPYIRVAYSTNYGSTWSTPINLDTLTTYMGYNSCHVSAHGNYVAVVWFDKKGNAVNVYFRESTDGGITWRPKVNLTGLVGTGDTAAGATVSVRNYTTYVTWFEKYLWPASLIRIHPGIPFKG